MRRRAFKTRGSTVLGILFLAIMLWMLVFQVKDKPVESLSGLAMMLAGLVVYFYGLSKGRENSAA